jgi:hypothetical protein
MQKKIFSQLIVYSVTCLTMLSGGKSPLSLLTPKQSMPAPSNQPKLFTGSQPVRISPPPIMAPKPIVTPPATSLITPIVPQQPAASQPVIQPMIQSVTPAVQSTITPVPTASTDDRTKLTAQQKFYNEISDKTTSDDLKKNVTELTKDIINPVTMKTIFSVSFIEDVKALIDLALKQLDIIFIQAKTSANTDKQAIITPLISQLKVAQDDINQYLQKIKAFTTQLQATKTINSTQTNEITVSFTNVTQQISGLLPNEVIQSYITGIDDLVKNAKANGQSNASAFKMLFDAVSKQQFLSIAAKQQILALLENRLRTLPRLFSILAAQGAAATIRPEIQARIQEAATKATMSDKIRYLRVAIPLINALALQGEKNALLSILNEILVSLQTLKKTDINELNALFSDLLNNKFIINSQQRYDSGEPWQKILAMAIDIMDESNMLLASIKQRIKIENNNFDMTMKSSFCGLSILLARPTDQEERKKDNKESLVWLLRHYIPLLYPNRAGKTQEQLYNLRLLFSLAKTIPEISDVINPVGQQAVSVILDLAIAKEITNTIAKIKAYEDISEILSPETKFESKEFGTDLSNIFTNRDKRAIKELDFFSTLLNELTSPAMQGKKVFEESDYKRFNEWKNILTATIKLMRDITYIQDPQEMINALDGIVANIANQTATFEKESFAPLLTKLFSKRGDYKQQTLVNFSLFLEKVGKTQSLLAPNQVAVIFAPSTTPGQTGRGPWLKDLDVAINYTKGTSDTYATVVLRKAVEKKSAVLLSKAITLFTPKTAQETKTLLAQSLQTFFDARNTLDKNALKDCFCALSKNKALPGYVGKDFMLDDAQRAVLDAWIDIIVKEIAQAPTSAPVPQAPAA